MMRIIDMLFPPRVRHIFMPGFSGSVIGKKLIKAKKWPEAEQYFGKLIIDYPANSIVREYLALSQRKNGKFREAEENYRILTRRHPGAARYARGLYKVLKKSGQEKASSNYLQDLMIRFPSSWKIKEIHASEILDKGDITEACSFFREHLTLKKISKSLAIRYLDLCFLHDRIDEIKKCAYFPEYSRFYLSLLEMYDNIKDFSGKYHREVNQAAGTVLIKKSLGYSDFTSQWVNYHDGVRKTCYVPPAAERSLYIFGPCHARGYGCEDAHTLPSQIQRQLNEAGAKVRVFNYGLGDTTPHSLACQFLRLLQLPITPGDCIVYVDGNTPYPLLSRSEMETHAAYMGAFRHYCSSKGADFRVISLPTLFNMPTFSKHDVFLFEYFIKNRVGEVSLDEMRNNANKDYDQRIATLCENGIPICDSAPLIRGLHSKHAIFLDPTHFPPKVFEEVARNFVTTWERNTNPAIREYDTSLIKAMESQSIRRLALYAKEQYGHNGDIQDWLHKVSNPLFKGCQTIGALVVNCNPFTKGHHYVISEAVKRVDALYVFVVQEDQSYFPFADRLRLVRKGTTDLGEKVHVVPSGEFIISSFSFPGYFSKEEQTSAADSTTDIALFGAIIAPSLNITRRFVGEEPNCVTTNEYNETMKFLLPPMGCEVTVIPRKTSDGEPISASKVRKYLAERNFPAIKELVPHTTYKYLVEKYQCESESLRVT